MSRWLQQGLSSLSQLREQASEFAQEVLSETKVEVEGKTKFQKKFSLEINSRPFTI